MPQAYPNPATHSGDSRHLRISACKNENFRRIQKEAGPGCVETVLWLSGHISISATTQWLHDSWHLVAERLSIGLPKIGGGSRDFCACRCPNRSSARAWPIRCCRHGSCKRLKRI